APRVIWPTSELPIWPSGRPTSMPEPEIRVLGLLAHRASQTGVLAAWMALWVGSSLCPQPSRTINTWGRFLAVIFTLRIRVLGVRMLPFSGQKGYCGFAGVAILG